MPSVKEIPVRFVVERAKAQDCAEAALPYRTLIADWYEENHYTLEGYETLHEIDEHFPELKEKPETDSQTEPVIIPGCVLGRFRTDPESARLLVRIIHEIHRRMTIPQKESRKATRPEDVRQDTWTWAHVMRVMLRAGIIGTNHKSSFGDMIERILGKKVKRNSIRRSTKGDYRIVDAFDYEIEKADADICNEIRGLFMPLLMPKK